MVKSDSILVHCFSIFCLVVLTYITSAAGSKISQTKTECRNVTTQMVVNVTISERCYGLFCWSNCYCNVTKEVPRQLTTQICEELILVEDDIETAGAKSDRSLRKLSDAELAAIAVIASLIFSIVISLIVFFIQSYHRRRAAENKARPTPDPELGDHKENVDVSGENVDSSDGANLRLLKLQPANREENVYEDSEAQTNSERDAEPNKLFVDDSSVDPDKERKHSLPETSSEEPVQLLTEPTASTEQYTTAAEPADSSQIDDISLDGIAFENMNNPNLRTTNL